MIHIGRGFEVQERKRDHGGDEVCGSIEQTPSFSGQMAVITLVSTWHQTTL